MNEEKMKRVIEAATQCKPLAKNDWPRGHEEWGWLLDRTCDLYSNYKSATISSVSIGIEYPYSIA